MTNELINRSQSCIKALYGLGAANVIMVLIQVAGTVAAKCDKPLTFYDGLIDGLLDCREDFKNVVKEEA